ncbi:MAG: DUF3078 domain-containing protein [Bacteroidales bacterium]|nr:DUF3078 domain-containing protein [Bacteroidales bacterium]
MKTLFFIASFFFFFGSLFAQTDTTQSTSNWKTGGMVSLNASQVSFTHWAAGGQNSISGNSFVNLFANYAKNKMTWDNTLDLGYGKMMQGVGEEAVYYKTDDKIDFASKYGQYAFEHWYYTGLISFKSQFDQGFKSVADTVRISNFLAPAYLNISIGMDYKPNDKFTLFISPVSGKITFVMDSLLSSQGAYGVTIGENVRYEFGGFVKAQYKVDLMKNISYTTKLELFSNYLKNPQNIDVNWENLINMKINSFFSANLHLTMLYDDDIKVKYDSDNDGIDDREGAKLQLKQLFGIGITYKF